MSNSNVWIVGGFKVKVFTTKKDEIEIKLVGNKDEIKAQEGRLQDVLASLELHQTSELDVELALGRCNVDGD